MSDIALPPITTGAFVPRFTFDGVDFAATGGTYAAGNQWGFWFKIGPLVFITLYIQTSLKGTPSGLMNIVDLPFPCDTSTAVYNLVPWVGAMATLPAVAWWQADISGNVTPFINVSQIVAGALREIDDTDFINGSRIRISGLYVTAA